MTCRRRRRCCGGVAGAAGRCRCRRYRRGAAWRRRLCPTRCRCCCCRARPKPAASRIRWRCRHVLGPERRAGRGLRHQGFRVSSTRAVQEEGLDAACDIRDLGLHQQGSNTAENTSGLISLTCCTVQVTAVRSCIGKSDQITPDQALAFNHHTVSGTKLRWNYL